MYSGLRRLVYLVRRGSGRQTKKVFDKLGNYAATKLPTFKLRRTELRHEFGIFARSVGVKFLKFCLTAARLQWRRHESRLRRYPSLWGYIRIVLLDIKGGV